MINVGYFFAGGAIYNLFDDGLANVLGVDTLRHGTNLLNNARIRIWGGDPNHGGKASGSTKGWNSDANTPNHFYVFKDSEWRVDVENYKGLIGLINRILTIKEIGYSVLPPIHAMLSGYNFVPHILKDSHTYRIIRYPSVLFSVISGIFNGVFSPTLRFRFSVIDPNRFENDPAYHGIAYRTKQAVESWRLGPLGTLLTGINLNWFSRARDKPLKILTGIVQLTCAVALTSVVATTLLANPQFAIPAAVGAILA